MIPLCALIIGVLQMSFCGILHARAGVTASSFSRNIDKADDFTAWDVVRRNLVVDDDNDNGSTVSHKVMQAIVVVLVLFLLLLFALFVFRKHRIRRLQQRWHLTSGLRVVPANQTFDDSSARPMSEIPMARPPPALSNGTYGTDRGRHFKGYTRQVTQD